MRMTRPSRLELDFPTISKWFISTMLFFDDLSVDTTTTSILPLTYMHLLTMMISYHYIIPLPHHFGAPLNLILSVPQHGLQLPQQEACDSRLGTEYVCMLFSGCERQQSSFRGL